MEGADEALWLAVSRLQAHVAVQQQLEEQLGPSGSMAAQIRARAAQALHAADLITRHVLPAYQAGPLDSHYAAANAVQPR